MSQAEASTGAGGADSEKSGHGDCTSKPLTAPEVERGERPGQCELEIDLTEALVEGSERKQLAQLR